MGRRTLVLFVVLAVGALTIPVSARPPDSDGEHKVWICHATRSLSNPYVKIEIDEAAWQGTGPRAHGDHHTRTKDGITWSDVLLSGPEEDCPAVPTPPEPLMCPGGGTADFVIEFPYDKLIRNTNETASSTGITPGPIPAGTYDVVLVSDSGTRGMGAAQMNEQWRMLIGGETTDYSDDLADNGMMIDDDQTDVGQVTLSSTTSSATAEHWNVAETSDSADSVIPEAACLTRANSR